MRRRVIRKFLAAATLVALAAPAMAQRPTARPAPACRTFPTTPVN